MRIVFLADDIDAVGGIQTATHTLAQQLARHGHHVHLVGLYRNTAPAVIGDQPLYQRIVLNAPPPHAPANTAQHCAAKQQISQILAGAGTTYLIMSSVHVSLWMQDVDTGGCARIGQYHGSYEYARTHYHLGVIRELWPTFDASVFLSPDDVAGFTSHTGLHAVSIPNPLPDAALHKPLPTIAAAVPRVLAVGRLTQIKRFDLAIDAFAQAAVAGWQLHIIGDGDHEPVLRRRISQVGSCDTDGSPAVVLRGRLPVAAMPAEYAAAQLLIVTSEHEGFGMVIAEAAAAAIPTVAFDVSGGVRSLVQHNYTGKLIPAGDLPAFATALRSLMLDPPRRHELGRAARRTIHTLDVTVVADRWERVLVEAACRARQEATR